MEKTYSAKQVASRIGVDARTFRKFLRSPAWPEAPVGRGGRYEFPQADLEAIRAQVYKWLNRRQHSS